MEITKKVSIPIEKRKNKFYVKSSAALIMLMGSAGVFGNLTYYNVEKEGNTYVVDVEVVKDRLKIIKERLEDLQCKKQIIEQILLTK
jgi:hypothetical protein